MTRGPRVRRTHRFRGRRAPGLIRAAAVIALTLLVLPIVALVVRVPWPEFGTLLTAPATMEALVLSLGTAIVATTCALILGVPLAVLMAEAATWPVIPRRLLRAAVTIPLILPPVVGGIALLALLGRRGIVGQWLAEAGLGIPYTPAAVVIAQVFVAMPFLVLAVEGALNSVDRRVEQAAASLGAGPGQVFRTVTLPLVAPGISAGAVLCFARALGEFGATITFAGSLPGVTRTLPVASYLAMQSDPAEAIVLALLLLVVAIAVLLALRDRWTPGIRG